LTGDDSELFDAPGELNAAFEPLLGSQSLIGLSGDRHRRMRQLLMPSFHGERMRSYGQVIQDITKEVMSEAVAGEPLYIRKITQMISMRVILRAVFGLNKGPRYQQLEHLLANMLDKMSNPWKISFLFFAILRRNFGPLSPWASFVRDRQQIDQLVYDEIAERRSHPDDSRTDILNLLLSARDDPIGSRS
jgi:cytochrome P450 family 110